MCGEENHEREEVYLIVIVRYHVKPAGRAWGRA